jgi:hypothetical protein
MGKVTEAAKSAAVKYLDRDGDGKLTRNDAAATARVYEERWPLGLLIAAVIGGFLVGLWFRGLFA